MSGGLYRNESISGQIGITDDGRKIPIPAQMGTRLEWSNFQKLAEIILLNLLKFRPGIYLSKVLKNITGNLYYQTFMKIGTITCS
jgi:hypothetical protein